MNSKRRTGSTTCNDAILQHFCLIRPGVHGGIGSLAGSGDDGGGSISISISSALLRELERIFLSRHGRRAGARRSTRDSVDGAALLPPRYDMANNGGCGQLSSRETISL